MENIDTTLTLEVALDKIKTVIANYRESAKSPNDIDLKYGDQLIDLLTHWVADRKAVKEEK